MMNVKQVMTKHLKEVDADGLFDGVDCACGLHDLMPCTSPTPWCVPAKKKILTAGDDEVGLHGLGVGDE